MNNEASGNRRKQALDGVKVLDFGWALVGSLTTKQLADHGAQVVRVESMTRIDLPRANRMTSASSANNPDDKPWFTHLNTSKYGMALNLKCPPAKSVIEKLIRWADVINANMVPGTLSRLGFGYDYVKTIKPDIIMAEGSAYGQTGPMAREWGVDGTGAALSGYLDLTGWPDRGPVGPNVPYGDVVLPFFIASAIVAALDYRRRTGKGQYIDGSMLDACTHQITPALLDYEVNQHLQTRNGNRIAHAAPHGVFPCQGDDRWCAIGVFTEEEWGSFCQAIGEPPWTKDARFATLDSRKENEDALEELVAEWARERSDEEIMKIMQAAGVPAGVVQTMQDILGHVPQLRERGFLVPLEHPVIGTFGHPTPPYKLSKTKAEVRTSPCLGEHTEYICTQLLSMSDEEFVELWQQGIFT
ncbi:MAG: CaiB/BaiF CoA transferase family protein [Dehalococcoidia bacterium]